MYYANCGAAAPFGGVEDGAPNTFVFGFLTNDVDLSVSAGAAPAAVVTGGQAAVSFRVVNHGPDATPGATLTIPLPDGVGFVSAVPSTGSCSYASHAIVCSLGALANGASATVAVVTTLRQAGVYALAATVSTPGNDDVAANDDAWLALFASDDAAVAEPVAGPPGAEPTSEPAAPVSMGPFMVQVQFRLPATCASPCKARAQLLVRGGAESLGSRAGLRMSGSGHVRFLISIDRASLLKARGSLDAKGYRTTTTRMVVWTRAANGHWSRTVKLGRIAVAVGRIESGKLPKLAGRVY